jgi:hypothetical protein
VYVDAVEVTATSRPETDNVAGTFANSTLNVMSRGGSSLFGAGTVERLHIFADLSEADMAEMQAARTASGPDLSPVGDSADFFYNETPAARLFTPDAWLISGLTWQCVEAMHGNGIAKIAWSLDGASFTDVTTRTSRTYTDRLGVTRNVWGFWFQADPTGIADGPATLSIVAYPDVAGTPLLIESPVIVNAGSSIAAGTLYWDRTAGVDGTGTQLSPFNNWASAYATIAATPAKLWTVICVSAGEHTVGNHAGIDSDYPVVVKAADSLGLTDVVFVSEQGETYGAIAHIFGDPNYATGEKIIKFGPKRTVVQRANFDWGKYAAIQYPIGGSFGLDRCRQFATNGTADWTDGSNARYGNPITDTDSISFSETTGTYAWAVESESVDNVYGFVGLGCRNITLTGIFGELWRECPWVVNGLTVGCNISPAAGWDIPPHGDAFHLFGDSRNRLYVNVDNSTAVGFTGLRLDQAANSNHRDIALVNVVNGLGLAYEDMNAVIRHLMFVSSNFTSDVTLFETRNTVRQSQPQRVLAHKTAFKRFSGSVNTTAGQYCTFTISNSSGSSKTYSASVTVSGTTYSTTTPTPPPDAYDIHPVNNPLFGYVNDTASNVFPAAGLTIPNGETRTIWFDLPVDVTAGSTLTFNVSDGATTTHPAPTVKSVATVIDCHFVTGTAQGTGATSGDAGYAADYSPQAGSILLTAGRTLTTSPLVPYDINGATRTNVTIGAFATSAAPSSSGVAQHCGPLTNTYTY